MNTIQSSALRHIILDELSKIINEQTTPTGSLTNTTDSGNNDPFKPTSGPGSDSWYTLEDDPNRASLDAVMSPETQWASATSSSTKKGSTKSKPLDSTFEFINNLIDQGWDEFKDTKLYSTLKQIQYDIESDWNSVWDENSEKRRKFRHDMDRLQTTIQKVITCWSNWDCFINGEEYGIRGMAYSPAGLTVLAGLSFVPVVDIGVGALFAVLVADDIKRFYEGERTGQLAQDFIMDILGTLSGGVGSAIAKTVLRDISAGLFPLMEAMIRGASGQELRAVIAWAQTLTKTKIGSIIEAFSPIAVMLKSAGNTIKQLINKIGGIMQNALRSLYELPIIGPMAREINATITYYLNQAKAFIIECIESIQTFLKILGFVWKFPRRSIEWILSKLGFQAPKWVPSAILASASVPVIIKGLEVYENWQLEQITQQMLNDNQRAADEAAAALTDPELAKQILAQQGRFTGADDYIYCYGSNPEFTAPDGEPPVFKISLDEVPDMVGAYCSILRESEDGEYRYIKFFTIDPGAEPVIVWVNSSDVEYFKWKLANNEQ